MKITNIFSIPNIIDYIRIIFLYKYLQNNKIHNILISLGLDLVDGKAARYFNQCTKFGDKLDKTIDYITQIVLYYKIKNLNLGLKYLIIFINIYKILRLNCFVTKIKNKQENKFISYYKSNHFKNPVGLLVQYHKYLYPILVIHFNLNNDKINKLLYYYNLYGFVFVIIILILRLLDDLEQKHYMKE